MTREEIYQMLLSTGYNVAYESFGEGQKNVPPYMIYSFPENHPFYADGIIYAEIDKLEIALYVREKDPEIEKKLESVLVENELTGFRKTENFYPDEKLFEIIYELEVYINA